MTNEKKISFDNTYRPNHEPNPGTVPPMPNGDQPFGAPRSPMGNPLGAQFPQARPMPYSAGPYGVSGFAVVKLGEEIRILSSSLAADIEQNIAGIGAENFLRHSDGFIKRVTAEAITVALLSKNLKEEPETVTIPKDEVFIIGHLR